MIITDMNILKIHSWQSGMLSAKLRQNLNAISQFFVLKKYVRCLNIVNITTYSKDAVLVFLKLFFPTLRELFFGSL